MNSWNNIVQTAMLGTDKKQLLRDELSEDLAAAYDAVSGQNTTDKEEQFLQMTAVVSNYRRCGIVPQQQQTEMEVAPAEKLPYCTASAAQALKAALNEEGKGLTKMWLELCIKHQQLVPPVLLTQLLEKAVKNKSLSMLVSQCVGNRGIWLTRYNAYWELETEVADEALWQTGTSGQRKWVLQEIRNTDPVRAREWLQAVWKQETANMKADLLQALAIGLSDDDLPWLEELVADKSQKVKDAAVALLANIPASSVVQRYLQIAQQSVVLKKEKTMLGLSSKTVLQVQLPAGYDETVFKTGIEKTTTDKSFTNEEWIVYQLIAHVPPQSWEAYFSDTPENILALFAKEKATELYIPAFAAAAGRFKDARWAKLLAADDAHYYEDIVPVLMPSEKERYLLTHLDQSPYVITEQLTVSETEWSREMTLAIFRHAAEAPSHYNRLFYNRYIHLFPPEVSGMLDQVVPKEGYQRSTWENTRDHIIRLLSVKQQIQQSF